MEYRKCLLVLLMISAVCCDLCEELDTYTNDSRCQAEYNDTFSASAVRIDNDIANVLIPNANPSCVSSNLLSLGSGGVLKVKVYTKSVTTDDYLTVFVYDAEDNVIGQAKLLDGENKDSDEWSVSELTLEGKHNYSGYIMIVGKASSDSEIMLKSICYSPAQQNSLSNSELTYQNYQDIYALQTGSILMSRGTVRVWNFNTEEFWTPLAISLAVIIPTVILALLCWACFALGRRQGAKQQTQVYEDIDNLPKPYLVPRVKSVYAESVTSSYGGRNNNIYSV